MITPDKTIQIYDEIRDLLLNRGMNYWQSIQALGKLDDAAYQEIAENYLNQQNNAQILSIYEMTISLANKPHELAQKIGMTLEQLQTVHYQKLTECLDELKKSLNTGQPAATPPSYSANPTL